MTAIPIRRRDTALAANTKLLSAAPLQELLVRMRATHADWSRYAPSGDATTTLGTIVADLAAAIARAEDVNVFMTIEQLAVTTGKPESTLTRLCRANGANIGATKVAGSWSIHWPTFEKFFTRSSKEPFIEEAA